MRGELTLKLKQVQKTKLKAYQNQKLKQSLKNILEISVISIRLSQRQKMTIKVTGLVLAMIKRISNQIH